MRKIPWTLIQVIEEVRDLRNVIEAVQSALDKEDSSGEKTNSLEEIVEPAIAMCLAELRALEVRIRPEHVSALLESTSKLLLRSTIWRLKANDASESIASLQRCKASLNLAISSHNL